MTREIIQISMKGQNASKDNAETYKMETINLNGLGP